MAKSDANFLQPGDHLATFAPLFSCFVSTCFFPIGFANFGVDDSIEINAHRNGIMVKSGLANRRHLSKSFDKTITRSGREMYAHSASKTAMSRFVLAIESSRLRRSLDARLY